jgi:hypothetical protein
MYNLWWILEFSSQETPKENQQAAARCRGAIKEEMISCFLNALMAKNTIIAFF